MKCRSCQSENREGVNFCEECGAIIGIVCPECGEQIQPDKKFCGACGYHLKIHKKPSPLNYVQPRSYTPKFLAEKILNSRVSLEGERKYVTVMFADVANFTSLSEKLDPEDVHTIMDGCFRILMEETHKFEGTINQFTGDGIMALLGAPVAHEDHAERACHAALSIQKAMEKYSELIAKDYGMEFKMRIGLNSGPVIVGAIGDDLRMDYTAIGDTTNLACRMEGIAEPGTIAISIYTYRLVKDYFECRYMGRKAIKGKKESQEIFELVKAGASSTRMEAAVAKGLTKFVGREKSMDAFIVAFNKVKTGSGQLVGVVGEAGVGKSRLLYEFKKRLRQTGITCLEGRCIHFGSAIPYLPVINILKIYFEIRERENEISVRNRIANQILQLDKKLEQILPPLYDLLSLKIKDEAYLSLEPKEKKERVFEALRDLIIRESQKKPVVLAIEDLHWVDKTSEEFLDYFINWVPQAKVMMVLLHRPDYTHKWGSKSFFNRIGVDQLTLQSSAKLVKAILVDGDVAPEIKDLILSRAAGNPFFMEELTHSLLENGSIQKRDMQYILTRDISTKAIPETVHGIIAARIDRLEENLKKIIQVASVIGREFDFRILQAITDMDQDLKRQLLNLQGLEFIYQQSLFPEVVYIFKHAITQDVAYNSLLSAKRREIHKKIGDAIEQIYAKNLEEFYEMLAYHYTRGDQLIKACEYLKLAGQKALGNNALWEAYAFYRDVLELLGKLPESPDNKTEKIDLIITLMIVPLELLGYPDDSFKYLRKCEQWAKDLGDTRRIATIYSLIGSYFTFSGDFHAALHYTEAGFESARKVRDIDLMVPLSYSLNNTYLAKGYYKNIISKAPEVIGIIEKSRRSSEFFGLMYNPYSAICVLYGLALGLTGRFGEGKAALEKALFNALSVGDKLSIGVVYAHYGYFYYNKGDWASAKEHYENGLAHFEEIKFHFGLAICFCGIGYAFSFLKDPESGKKYVEKGIQLHLNCGVKWLLSLHNWMAGSIYLDLGDIERAEKTVEEALRLSVINNEKDVEGIVWLARGRILGKSNLQQVGKVEEYFFKGMEILEDLGMKPACATGYQYLGEFYLDAGNDEKALQNLKQAEAMFESMGMDYWLERAQTLLTKVK
jgi:class 3 adenylate cyclase/tetratricopeptide (TPR) repeat protein